MINGGGRFRDWVDDADAAPGDLESLAAADERRWREECSSLMLSP